MKNLCTLLLAVLTVSGLSVFGSEKSGALPAKETRCFEMRIYYAAPGKLDALQARFRDHTLKLFEKHGIVNIGYWVPLDNTDNKLIYLLAYPSREAQQTMWKAFGADPEWKEVVKQSQANGKLTTKVEHLFLTATDYSPAVQPAAAASPRAFELRTYTASAGNLDALNARFRDHTLKLFAKHGLTSIGYWLPDKDQKDSDRTLIYILAHKSKDAAAQTWAEFRADPDWIAAKAASEKKAGGSLTEAGTNGVKSVFVTPTDFSPMK